MLFQILQYKEIWNSYDRRKSFKPYNNLLSSFIVTVLTATAMQFFIKIGQTLCHTK